MTLYQHLSKLYKNIASSAMPEEVFYHYVLLLFIILQALIPLSSYLDRNKALQLTLNPFSYKLIALG